MVCIASISTYDGGWGGRTGLRRALLSRRANLGDCTDARSVFARIASARYLRHPACVIPLSRARRGELSSVALALDVARRALAAGASGVSEAVGAMGAAETIGAIVYCHAVPDEQSSDSSAGHLQYELGLREAVPFSISQAHNTATLIGLDLAAALIEGPEALDGVLLVAADKLRFGKPPTDPRRMEWADVAAAAVIRRDARTGWRVRRVAPGQFATPLNTRDDWPDDERQRFAQYCATMLTDCVRNEAGPVDALVAATPDAAFARRVHALARIAHGPREIFAPPAVATADLLLQIAGLEPETPPGRSILAWSNGNNGEFACCLLTRIG